MPPPARLCAQVDKTKTTLLNFIGSVAFSQDGRLLYTGRNESCAGGMPIPVNPCKNRFLSAMPAPID
jgi:hypothetical protein